MQDVHQTILYPDWISNWRVVVAFWFLLWGGGSLFSVQAQVGAGAAEALTSRERPVRISLQPTYQRFEDGDRVITQWSVPIVAVVPFADRWQVSIRGSGASASGKDLQTLSGFSDIRTTLSYAQPIGEGSLIVNASVNAPTGKEELAQDEFNTARLLSRNFYRFRVPSFGQGFGAGAGLTWAVPVAESVVIGIGGAFRYRGSYTPTAGQQAEYDPGEEGRITGGVDVRLGQSSALSVDGSFYLYGTDTVGGDDQFDTGNHVSVRVQFLREGERHTIRVRGQYRQQEKSTLPIRDGSDRELQVLPSRGVLQARYTVGLSRDIDMGVSAAGRWYDETTAFGSKTMGTIGLEPRFSIREPFTITPRFAYTAGSIMGLEGGVGLTAQF